MFGDSRYGDILEDVLSFLNGKEILYKSYEDDYQGYVDVDMLLSDGRVFSYYYSYGSCSGCDEWEAEEYSNEKIKVIMIQEATFFDNIDMYNEWCKTNKSRMNYQKENKNCISLY
jgi:hypothetical protein